MAWEKRANGRRYYTRSKWVRGRVKRQYIPLSVAHLVAQFDRQEREEREILAEDARQERQEREAWYIALFEPLDALADVCDALVTQELTAAGYRLVGGRWRRPRHGRQHDEADQEAQARDEGERRDDAGGNERASGSENRMDR